MTVVELVRALNSFPAQMEVVVVGVGEDDVEYGFNIEKVDVMDSGQSAYISLLIKPKEV